MESQKNSKGLIAIFAVIIVILLILVILLAIGTISFKSNQKIPSGSDKQTNENASDNNEDKEQKYINYTSYDVPLYSRKRNNNLYMKLNIVDGKLNAILEEEVIPVNGINGQVKSFLFGNDCGSSHYYLALTTDNKVYFSSYFYDSFADDENHALNFKEILANNNIVNITKINYAGFRTCGNHDFGVVLDNNEIRALYSPIIKDENGNYKTGEDTLGRLDYSQIKYTTLYWPSIVVYSDNTISELLDEPYDGPIENKISYNNEKLILEKYFSVSDNKSSYVISNGKLYRLNWKNEDEKTLVPSVDSIELVNNSKIDNESLSVSIGKNEFYPDKKNNTIKFVDGTSFEITDIQYVYSVK